ncbi:MAG: tRNA (adenosine(37)-N6)-threonylcarbamoyltransferase complex ATPase subunit type 1 TsaE [Chromatiales bacterium]|jgi:tRNA threonylcarbamoyladenosine biosynthesis protein TsaE
MPVATADSEAAQERIGAALAGVCPKRCVVFLEGELGAGKTTLVRGFLRGLGHRGPVKSPTYTLVEPYRIGDRLCYHLDLYRVADPAELEYIGLRDLLREPAVLLVEWPERGLGGLPDADLCICIDYAGQGRILRIEGLTRGGRDAVAALEAGSRPA